LESVAGPLPRPATHRILALGGRAGERAGAARQMSQTHLPLV